MFGKYSFVYRGMTAQWLVNVRLIIAGIILLTAVYRKQGKDTWRVWKNKRHAIRMILYGVIGIAACQMTYYMAVDDSNAGIATVLQYTAPVMIMIYLAIRNRKMPNCTELTALFLAFVGTVLSFGCYMEGVRLIGGTKASLFASIEPLTATVISILFMGVAFSWMDLFGFVGIIGAVTILSLPKKKA